MDFTQVLKNSKILGVTPLPCSRFQGMNFGFLILRVLHYLENAPLAFYINSEKAPLASNPEPYLQESNP
jgi:hypothetical protein